MILTLGLNGYAPPLALATGQTEIRTVYVSDTGNDINTGASAQAALQTLAAAIEKAEGGGTIIICGELTITDLQTYIKLLDGNLTITGKDNTTDYHGKLTIQHTTPNKTVYLHCQSPVQFEYLQIDSVGNKTLEIYSGVSLTMGKGMTITENGDRLTGNTVVVRGGVRLENCVSSSITILSGTFGYVAGGNNKKNVTNSTITIGGSAEILSFVQGGGTDKTVTNSTITVNGCYIPKLYIGGYGTTKSNNSTVSANDATIGLLADMRSPGNGAAIQGNVSIELTRTSVNSLSLNSVPPQGQEDVVIRDCGIMRLDGLFDGFDNASIYGDTTIYIGNFIRPTTNLFVDSGASIVLDEIFNKEIPAYTGNGSITISKIPITDITTNYQGSQLLRYTRVAGADGTVRSAQGIAGYENYIIVLLNGGTANIYDMESETPGTPVAAFDLASFNVKNPDDRYTNHCNSVVFGSQKFKMSDPFPLLYITTGHTYDTDKYGYIAHCSVERIIYDELTKTWSTQIVQTIIFNDNDYPTTYDPSTNTFTYPNNVATGFVNTEGYEKIGRGWPTWFVDSSPTAETSGYIYTFRSRFGSTITAEKADIQNYGITDYMTDNAFIITKFNLPKLPDTETDFGQVVTLTPQDIVDQFTTAFSLYYTQGGTMYQNNIYFMCGHGEQTLGFKDGMNVFNVADKKIISKVDLSTSVFALEELQGALIYNGQLVINTNNNKLYRFDYIHSDWLIDTEASYESMICEKIIDCVSGQTVQTRQTPVLVD